MQDQIEVIRDEEIYSRFLEGETTVFDELMIRYGNSLTFYLHGITHDWHEAEDIMIEAFARIMVKKPRIKEGAIKAYIFKTGRNLALNTIRKNRTLTSFSLEDLNEEPEAEEYIEEHLVAEENREVLHLCLERIDPQLKEAMWLIYFENMTYAQAAKIMKVNAKKIDHLLERAKNELRSELKKEGVHDANV